MSLWQPELGLADLGQPSGLRLVGSLPGLGRSMVRFTVPAELGSGPRLPGRNELGAWLQNQIKSQTGRSVLVTAIGSSTTWIAGQTYYDMTVDVASAEPARVERVTAERIAAEEAVRGIAERERQTPLLEKIFGGLPGTARSKLKDGAVGGFGFPGVAVGAAIAIGLFFLLRRR